MVVEVKAITQDNLNVLFEKMGRLQKKTLNAHFGKLKRGIDGVEYQKKMRDEWD